MRGLEESGRCAEGRDKRSPARGLARVVKRDGRNEISNRELGEAVSEHRKSKLTSGREVAE